MPDTDHGGPVSRRAVLVAGVTTFPLIAGCGGNENAEDADGTDRGDDGGGEGIARIGERVGDDALSLVVETVERTEVLGEFDEADPGNEFVVVTVAVKNETDGEYLDFNSFVQTRLTDAEAYTYAPRQAATARPLEDRQLAPGELSRGDVVFEVPEDAAELVFQFDLAPIDQSSADRVHVDLTEEPADVAALEQELHVDVHEVGDTVAESGLMVTLNDVRTETTLGDVLEAAEGNEYVIVDSSVTNETGEARPVSVALQMVLKDADGWTYIVDGHGQSALSRSFAQLPELRDGETRRGEITYQAPAGAEPLYWTFDFDLRGGGTKTFWRLR